MGGIAGVSDLAVTRCGLNMHLLQNTFDGIKPQSRGFGWVCYCMTWYTRVDDGYTPHNDMLPSLPLSGFWIDIFYLVLDWREYEYTTLNH